MHFRKCNFTGNPPLSNPSTAATALSPITCTQAAFGKQAFVTVSCIANSGGGQFSNAKAFYQTVIWFQTQGDLISVSWLSIIRCCLVPDTIGGILL